MAGQKFYAHPTDTFTWPNGAVGHRPGGSFDCLGPYAKVRNCPIAGTQLRLTCYASGYADTYFSVPAVTEHKGKRIVGYFASDEDGIYFNVVNRHKHLVGLPWDKAVWFAELKRIAAEKKLAHYDAESGPLEERQAWKSRFEAGMSPQQAWFDVPYSYDWGPY